MLRPILASGVLAFGILFLSSTHANADPDPKIDIPPKPGPEYVLRCSTTEFTCNWFLIKDTNRAGDGEDQSKPGAKKVKQVCNFGGTPQACTNSELGNWSNSQQCYLQRETPQPPYSDPRWQGHTEGSIWACLREQGYDEGRHIVTRWVWLPGEPDTVVIDPETLAYRAIASMQLGKPQIRTAPGAGQIGLVNMPVWLWVDKSENTWGPIVRQASVPGLTVTATAQVKALNWSMGLPRVRLTPDL
ncbi:hypothetical protein FB561_4104 [Kribbella amoyensis]|uniref:Uncharacterized protein n=1 Tax=Kribbella amoyensis TaxID=996641 RepID=A0A561BVU3_9ACTN|nr:hypothetical protein [Kribbella amoyensis]TWD82953.1 hypothetical protein FB561_4104 [Kribbella amoyensis]